VRRPDPELVAFYERYAHLVLRRARGLVADPAQAAAVVSGSFSEAIAAWDRVRESPSPLGWLVREALAQARVVGGAEVLYWSEAGGDELTWRCLVLAHLDRASVRETAELLAITDDEASAHAPVLRSNSGLSWLRLERFAAGELVADDRAEAQRALFSDPGAMQHLDALKRLRKEVPAFDIEAAVLRRPTAPTEDPAPPAERQPTDIEDDQPQVIPDAITAPPAAPREVVAGELEATPQPITSVKPIVRVTATKQAPLQVPPPAVGSRVVLWAAPLVIAILFALVVAFQWMRPPAHAFEAWVGEAPYRGEVLEAGATVRFVTDAPAVLLAVEPDGTITTLHPSSGDAAAPVGREQAFVVADGRGPEMIVAVYGRDVAAARAAVADAYGQGQSAGVRRWIEAEATAAAVVIQRR
jgi:hypothetical protein